MQKRKRLDARKIGTRLAQGQSELDNEIAQLKKQRCDVNQNKIKLIATLRNTINRRQRLRSRLEDNAGRAKNTNEKDGL